MTLQDVKVVTTLPTPAAIFFDFDGVILDSVEIKTNAFRKMFADESTDSLDAIVALHRRLGGISRYAKFDMIYRDILGLPLSSVQSAELGARFQNLVFEGVMLCNEIPGARSSLNRCLDMMPLFVVSGTPQEELDLVVAARDFGRYFAEVHGSPRGKEEIMADVLARHALSADACIMIGDAESDGDAAARLGIKFLGVVANGLANPFDFVVPIVPDLRQFESGMACLGFSIARSSSHRMESRG